MEKYLSQDNELPFLKSGNELYFWLKELSLSKNGVLVFAFNVTIENSRWGIRANFNSNHRDGRRGF